MPIVTTTETVPGHAEFEILHPVHILVTVARPGRSFLHETITSSQMITQSFDQLGEAAQIEGADAVVGVRFAEVANSMCVVYGTAIRFR